MQEIEKLLYDDTQASLQETQKQVHDISELCGEAYKNLLDNQSFDLTKISQIQAPQIDDIGEWDSKLESSRDKTSEFDQIRKAFQVLDKAKLFEPSNLQMLMKCAENTDKQIYMDFFFKQLIFKGNNKNLIQNQQMKDHLNQESRYYRCLYARNFHLSLRCHLLGSKNNLNNNLNM